MSKISTFFLYISLFVFRLVLASFGAIEGQCPCRIIRDKGYNTNNDTETSHSLNICISSFNNSKQFLRDLYIPNKVIWSKQEILITESSVEKQSSHKSSKICSIIINTTPSETLDDMVRKSLLCPGSCTEPVPEVSIPLVAFQPINLHSKSNATALLHNFALTCSLTYNTVVDIYQKHYMKSEAFKTNYYQIDKSQIRKMLNWPTTLIILIAMHRFKECEELGASYLINTEVHAANTESLVVIAPPRREVLGVILWIGSKDKLHHIRQQYKILDGQASMHGTQPVVGWAATDELYACRPNSTVCRKGGNFVYRGFLPKAAMNFGPRATHGYRCAQRRPLRALAHVLTLFKPKFLVLLDDDSFFNYPLFKQKFLHTVLEAGSSSPVVWGETIGNKGENGHISKLGIFVGGSGYIMGCEVLRRLASPRLRWFGHEIDYVNNFRNRINVLEVIRRLNVSDTYRSEQQILYLSVSGEGLKKATYSCKEDNLVDNKLSMKLPCINVATVSEGFVNISVRAVDFCVNLMAEEHTCHQSDHSVSRCLVYAVAAEMQPTYCHFHSSVKRVSSASVSAGAALSSRSREIIGLCNMAPQCDLSRHLVCHRYRYLSEISNTNLSKAISVERTVVDRLADRAYYRKYSSIVDENGAVQTHF